MIKLSALLIGTISAFIFPIVNNEINVTSNIPQNLKTNSEYTIELTINKGDIGGFAKLEQELPEGFTADAIDVKGGSFKFDNQKIKIIWMALPSAEEFKISYKLKVANLEKGQKTIQGKVFFLQDKDRKISELIPTVVDIN